MAVGLRRALYLVSAMALVVLAASGLGRAAPLVPYYELGQIQCLDGGQMRTWPPRVMRPVYNVNFRNAELVKWSPDLQVWRGGRWVNYDIRQPFYQAATSIYGFYQDQISGGWTGARGQIRWVPFFDLPAGIYRIRHWLWWQQLGRTYPVAGTRTCRFS